MKKWNQDFDKISTVFGIISIFSILLLLLVALLFFAVVTAAKASGDSTAWIQILDKTCIFCGYSSMVLPPVSGAIGLITEIIALRSPTQQLNGIIWSGISLIIFILILFFRASH